MGEAGLGKSRLVAELNHALEAEGVIAGPGPTSSSNGSGREAITWCEGRCLSYQTATPYASFVTLFETCFGLGADQSDEEKYETIAGRVSRLLPGRELETAPYLATMLGVSLTGEAAERTKYLEPPQVRDGVFNSTLTFLEALATERPLVLTFEDIHWIDPTSLELLEQLMSLTERAPLTLIGIFRPWRQEPSWRYHEAGSRDYGHRYTSVLLEPLDKDQSRELVANLLHVEDLPERVRALILTKAEGNPFFVEEVIRSLLDAELVVRVEDHWQATQEIEHIAVPDTLSGVITARLDRLDDVSKRVAQTASVLGREFQFDSLADVYERTEELEPALTDLQRRELVRETSRLPRRVYMFKHAMTQETAYDSLLLSSRRQLHKRVAESMVQTDREQVNEIARHFLDAREQARALPYLVEAGDRAARANATSEAMGLYRRALEILESVDNLIVARRAYEGLGGVLRDSFDVDASEQTFDKMLALAQERDDHPMQVSAHNKLGFVKAVFQGRVEKGDEHFAEAQQLANGCGDMAGLAEAHMNYCYIRTATGDFDDAVDHLKGATQLGDEVGIEEAKLFGLTHTANTMMYMTRFEEGWKAVQDARHAAEESGNKKYLSELMALTSPLYHMRNGELDAASYAAREGADVASEIGSLDNESCGEYIAGQVAWMRGDYETAIELQQRALEAARRSGIPYLQTAVLCALGTAYLDISSDLVHKTMDCHNEAKNLLDAPLGSVLGAMAWADLGFCEMALGDLDSAGDWFHKGLTLPSSPMYLLRPRLLIGSALVALMQNDAAAAWKLCENARGVAEASAMQHFYPLIAFADGNISAARGDVERGLDQFARAEELGLNMQMRPVVWQARAAAGQVLAAQGRVDEAEAQLHGARAVVDEIAGLFRDHKLRDKYLQGVAGKLSQAAEAPAT